MSAARRETRFPEAGACHRRFAPVVAGLLLLAAGPLAAQEREQLPSTLAPQLNGISGLINTPTADILPDGSVRFGYSHYPAAWAYEGRGRTDNDVYFLTFGFLPRLEVSLRATVFPDLRLIEGDDPTVDRLGSFKLQVLPEGKRRPAVAVGVDDVRGTRRFHSLYLVTSKSVSLSEGGFRARGSLGYGSTELEATRHILAGWFGGAEVTGWDRVAATLEFDTEKWNTSIRLILFSHLAAQVVLLDMDTVAPAVSWYQKF